ncbi:MAG TPA: hypothetical protein DCG49_08000 [Ruminococcus sp.]|nr:hypothetical protein [Ruminococcus sp.]
MSKQTGIRSVLFRILQIIILIAAILSFGCGSFLLFTGISQEHTLANAQDTMPSASVRVTALEQNGTFDGLQIVVVEAESQDIAKQLGITSAAAWRAKVAVGDTLTMYYDPDDPQNRIIDFRTADVHKRNSFVLFGISVCSLCGFLILHKFRK